MVQHVGIGLHPGLSERSALNLRRLLVQALEHGLAGILLRLLAEGNRL